MHMDRGAFIDRQHGLRLSHSGEASCGGELVVPQSRPNHRALPAKGIATGTIVSSRRLQGRRYRTFPLDCDNRNIGKGRSGCRIIQASAVRTNVP